jgi:hypothetical protein
MKGLAITLLLIFVWLLLCAGIIAFAQEPTVPPVIMRAGLTVESCSDTRVIITAPLNACRYVVHQKTISKPRNLVTVTVKCEHDPVTER